MNVYLLWHIHHFNQDEAGNIQHFEEDGSVVAYLDDEDGDCFVIDEYTLNEDQRTEGYVTVSAEE